MSKNPIPLNPKPVSYGPCNQWITERKVARMNISRAVQLGVVLTLLTVDLSCPYASDEEPVVAPTAALPPMVGTWTGVDTATGTAYYRLEVGASGTGILAMAANRFPVDCWKIESIRSNEPGVFELSLAPVSDGTQKRAATITVKRYWATTTLELQMSLIGDGKPARIPDAARRVLLRAADDIRQLDRLIERAKENVEGGNP